MRQLATKNRQHGWCKKTEVREQNQQWFSCLLRWEEVGKEEGEVIILVSGEREVPSDLQMPDLLILIDTAGGSLPLFPSAYLEYLAFHK